MIETVEERLVYENAFVRVFDDRVRFPDGSPGTYFRTQWRAPFGVAVVAVQEKEVVLVRNHRYSERAWSVEIPQGFGNLGETPEDAARRELFEETGLKTASIEPLMVLGSAYRTHIHLAVVASTEAADLSGIEPSEAISGVHRLAVDCISVETLSDLGVFDSVTFAGLLAFALRSR
jgi:ADP-ribose pyrophosphatase YjhB (NUDIX family)